MSYKDLAGKTYVVTGAASGMGRAISILLAQQGANVGMLDLRAPEAVATEIEKAGGKCLALACNVQDAEAVNSSVKAVVEKFGALHGE